MGKSLLLPSGTSSSSFTGILHKMFLTIHLMNYLVTEILPNQGNFDTAPCLSPSSASLLVQTAHCLCSRLLSTSFWVFLVFCFRLWTLPRTLFSTDDFLHDALHGRPMLVAGGGPLQRYQAHGMPDTTLCFLLRGTDRRSFFLVLWSSGT
jgi:hypothetical protein